MSSGHNPTVEILSQGEELVAGQTADSNAVWLARELVRLGCAVTRHTVVGDRLESLVAVLQEIARRADACIGSGGLGPTQDDLTAEAVARAFGRPLRFDPAAMGQIEAFFSRSGRPMPEINRKQAWLPEGSMRIDNAWGTAPGFALQHRRCWFTFVPGVPSEMRNLFREWVQAELQRRFALTPWRRVTLRVAGEGESALQEKLDRIAFPRDIVLGFRSATCENQIKLLFPPGFPEYELNRLVRDTAASIGSTVFSIEGLGGPEGGLPDVVGAMLELRGESIAVVETVSSGLIASQCAGAAWLRESLVIPDSASLCRRFDVPAADRSDDSSLVRTAKELALAVRARAGTCYGIAQLATMDHAPRLHPERGAAVCTALAAPTAVLHHRATLGGEAHRRRAIAAMLAFDLLRRHLQGIP